MSRKGNKRPSEASSETDPDVDDMETDGSPDAKIEKLRSTHNGIEKRRRDKVKEYIDDLSKMIPIPPSMKTKPDKLTVLRLTVEHMKALQGLSEPLMESNHKPDFMTDNDLCSLLVQASGGFLLVVDCDQGEVVYVTESVQEILNITQADFLHNDLFKFLHSRDVVNVKSQLLTISNDDVRKEFSSDKVCPGARRAFFCRMKKGAERDASFRNGHRTKDSVLLDESNHVLMSFEGYLKYRAPSSEKKQSKEPRCCLVVMCRPVKVHDQQTDYSEPGQIKEFESRHSADSVFSRVDKGLVTITGWHPDEIVGESPYKFFHPDDLRAMARRHHQFLCGIQEGFFFRWRTKAGHYIPVRNMSITVFRNPWTEEIDFFVAKNIIMTPVLPSLLFINEKRRLEKEAESVDFSAVSSSDQFGLTVGMEDLLKKMACLDSKEGNSGNRDVASSATTNWKNGENSPEHGIGVLIVEHVKSFENDAQTAQHTNEPLADETKSQPAFSILENDRSQEGPPHPTTDSSHESVYPLADSSHESVYPLGQSDLTQSDLAHGDLAQSDLAQGDHAQSDLAQGDLAQSGLTHNMLMEQMEEIKTAIDAMNAIAANQEEEEEHVNYIDNGDEDDIPWNLL